MPGDKNGREGESGRRRGGGIHRGMRTVLRRPGSRTHAACCPLLRQRLAAVPWGHDGPEGEHSGELKENGEALRTLSLGGLWSALQPQPGTTAVCAPCGGRAKGSFWGGLGFSPPPAAPSGAQFDEAPKKNSV